MEVDSDDQLRGVGGACSNTARDVLLRELENWTRTNNGVLALKRDGACEDGRIMLEFSIGSKHEFTLYCPADYPRSEDHFFVEAMSSLQFWCNTINEFILDSPVAPTLSAVLQKASLLYRKEASNPGSMSSSDSDDDDDEYMVVEDDNTDEEQDCWEHVLSQKKKRWRVKESLLRAANNQPKISDMFDGTVKDHPKQVFSNSGASGILTNDLVAIMECSKPLGICAEPIEDNIYQWSVRLSLFEPKSPLNDDLCRLQVMFGYDYIELQLDFAMDLYPFYPPVVKVVRPRLQGCMMMLITGMDVLKLSHWNPARNMKSVLQEIKDFMGKWARLDLSSERNSLLYSPQGAYIDLENDLLWLAWVSEVPPRAYLRYPQLDRDAAPCYAPSTLLVDKDKVKEQLKNVFPAGTGYSSSCHKGWDVNAYLAAQREKDAQLVKVLRNILMGLRGIGKRGVDDVKLHSIYSSFTIAAPNVPAHSSSSSSSNSADSCNQNKQKPIIDPADDLFRILEASTLVPFLELKLRVDTFLEISKHTSVYSCIMEIISEMASRSCLVPLLWALPDQVQSLYTLLARLEDKARVILTHLGKSSSNGSVSASDCDPPSSEESLARAFCEMSCVVRAALQEQGLLAEQGPSCSTACTGTSPEPLWRGDEGALAHTYVAALRDLQFLSCDIEVNGASAHQFSTHFKRTLPPKSAQVMRIAQEMDALSTSLPLDLGSAIFIRTDDAKCTLLRALIIGPEGTPYSNGCFQFDIFFPSHYPTVPPLVNFCTTGLGHVRFNPNLYESGMVCLSLLGTWKGLLGEQWHPDTSSLLQVLVSIQSLILVQEPYFNEPGFEVLLGTDKGTKASKAYNDEVKYYTIVHAMLAQLQRPSSGFEDVIRVHFQIKKNRILQDIKNYMKTYRSSVNMEKAYRDLKVELDKLAPYCGRLETSVSGD